MNLLGIVREVLVSVRRIEAFLGDKFENSRVAVNVISPMHTGRTTKSGFPLSPPEAALAIISSACFKLSVLLLVIWPSWINAIRKGLALIGETVMEEDIRIRSDDDSTTLIDVLNKERVSIKYEGDKQDSTAEI
jgi:predicted RNA-binding protein